MRRGSLNRSAPSGSTKPQPDLFGTVTLPAGFRYQRELLSADEEHSLLREFQRLPFRQFEFHGFLGKRRVVSFGWRYDFNEGGLKPVDDLPEFLLPVRRKAASFAQRPASSFQQALITEYTPGATIGWHRDRSVFGDVVGVSLLASCTLRLRRKVTSRWERVSFVAEPRSVYLLSGSSRSEWEHSIPPVERLRYSITFRSLK